MRSLARGLGYAAAGFGLLIAGALALGIAADLLVNLVQLVVGLTAFAWVVVGSGVAVALWLLWLWDRRR